MSDFLGALTGLFFVVFAAVVIIAATSLRNRKPPATPPFARRPPTGSSNAIHQDNNARFLHDRGFMYISRLWFTGTCCPPMRINKDFYDQAMNQQWQEPAMLVRHGRRNWWIFEGAVYWETTGYTAHDMLALIRDKERRQQAKLERARLALRLDQQPRPRRTPLPKPLKRAVFDRDGGQCVECGSTFDLQYDHIIPVVMGGATSLENLQLLCSACNQSKGGNL